ncbi:hypothetical protein MRX96_016742 [Rhipicephalus microplus]
MEGVAGKRRRPGRGSSDRLRIWLRLSAGSDLAHDKHQSSSWFVIYSDRNTVHSLSPAVPSLQNPSFCRRTPKGRPASTVESTVITSPMPSPLYDIAFRT